MKYGRDSSRLAWMEERVHSRDEIPPSRSIIGVVGLRAETEVQKHREEQAVSRAQRVSMRMMRSGIWHSYAHSSVRQTEILQGWV